MADIKRILKPLENDGGGVQAYIGTGLHTLGLLGWILEQTGKADVYVTTFSTSDAFLSGFLRLRLKGLVNKALLAVDLKAAKKTIRLNRLMTSFFDDVYLCMNHSKIVLVNNSEWTVSVITSQNQTYGDRAECTMVSVSQRLFSSLYCGLMGIIENKSIRLDELHGRTAGEDI